MTLQQAEQTALAQTGFTMDQLSEIRKRLYQETGQVPETAPPDVVARITDEVTNPQHVIKTGIFADPQEAMRNTTGNTGVAGPTIGLGNKILTNQMLQDVPMRGVKLNEVKRGINLVPNVAPEFKPVAASFIGDNVLWILAGLLILYFILNRK